MSYNLESFELPLSLWRLIEENVALREREEIKKILGESLVEQSLELHREIEVLLEIWRDYRTEEEADEPSASAVSQLPSLDSQGYSRERELLVNHIRVMAEQLLQDKAKDAGRDSGLAMGDNEILDYVLTSPSRVSTPSCGRQSTVPSRPSTAFSSRDGRETPLRITPSDGDRLSETTSVTEQVEAVKDKLSILQIDETVQQLRDTLEEECNRLLMDIQFLQECLDEESEFRVQSTQSENQMKEPTMQELKEQRAHLQKLCEPSVDSIQAKRQPVLKKVLPNSVSRMSPSKSEVDNKELVLLKPSPPSSAKKAGRPNVAQQRLLSTTNNARKRVSQQGKEEKQADESKQTLVHVIRQRKIVSVSDTSSIPSPPYKLSSAEKFRRQVLDSRNSSL